MGLSDSAVLEALLHKGPMPVNTIGAKVRLTSGSITAAVDRLGRKGSVERCPHESDRRARVVKPTERGRGLIECAFADHRMAMEQARSGLSDREKADAAELLKKLGLHAWELAPASSRRPREPQ